MVVLCVKNMPKCVRATSSHQRWHQPGAVDGQYPHAVPDIIGSFIVKTVDRNLVQPAEGPGVEFGPCLAQSTLGNFPDIEITAGKGFVEPVQVTLQSGLERHDEKY